MSSFNKSYMIVSVPCAYFVFVFDMKIQMVSVKLDSHRYEHISILVGSSLLPKCSKIMITRNYSNDYQVSNATVIEYRHGYWKNPWLSHPILDNKIFWYWSSSSKHLMVRSRATHLNWYSHVQEILLRACVRKALEKTRFTDAGAPSGLSRTNKEAITTVQGFMFFNIKRNIL